MLAPLETGGSGSEIGSDNDNSINNSNTLTMISMIKRKVRIICTVMILIIRK